MKQITIAPNFEAWQKAARRALHGGLEPEALAWETLQGEQPALAMFDEMGDEQEAPMPAPAFRVPKGFLPLARAVSCHRDPARWPLLYRVLWRLTHGEPHLLEIAVDPDIYALTAMNKAIRHDVHKMRAFVRFREVQMEDGPWYVAWFEPEHHIVEMNAPFFVDRFASMRWAILTPDRCVHWDGERLSYTAGVSRSEAPEEDATEELWLKYYGQIFNPARANTRAMQAEMPKRYWKNLPEAAIIPALLEQAPKRVEKMIAASRSKAVEENEHSVAQPPATTSLTTLREAAAGCTACPLYRNATQTVFGVGPKSARVILLGEQPGDQEDRQGHPFVGPAGQLLDRALEEAGIDRSTCYVTNVVKHFKWEPRGKRRLHSKPNGRDIAACRPWMEAEIGAIRPEVLICLGGTAAKAILGSEVKVLRDRGQIFETEFCAKTFVTVHPSSLLRAPSETEREAAYAAFIKDLRAIAAVIGGHV